MIFQRIWWAGQRRKARASTAGKRRWKKSRESLVAVRFATVCYNGLRFNFLRRLLSRRLVKSESR